METQQQTSGGAAESGGRDWAPALAWLRRHGPVALLCLSLLGAAVVYTLAGWSLTFFQDTWAFLLDRQATDVDAFLLPHNEHIVVVPVAITRLLLEVFGMSSNTPEQVAMALTVFACAILLFVYVRRRVDPWLAAMAAALLLFLGSSWPIILWPFENEFTIPIAAGIGMLLLLDREDSRGDAWACAALLLAVLSGSLGIAFGIAAGVDFLLKYRSRGWKRAYVFLVPGLVYIAWYLGWGHNAETHLALRNILDAPHYVMDGFASALGSLAGLGTTPVNSPGQPDWGRPLLIGAIGLFAFGQWRRPGIPRTFWPILAAALTYWLLAAFNYIPGREAASTRYVFAAAVFILLMAAELLRGVNFSRRGLLVAGIVTVCAIGPNLAQMKDGRDWLKEQTIYTRGDLAALEIARDTIQPYFNLASYEIAGTASLAMIEAAKYFEAADRWGSPAYSPQELSEAPARPRRHADLILSQALPLSTETTLGEYDFGGAAENCLTVNPGPDPSEVLLFPGETRIEVAPGGPADFKLRRFATGVYPVDTEGAPGESTTLLTIPRDRALKWPWYLQVTAAQPVRVCR